MNDLKVKVENMVSPSSGREVANQFVIYVGDKVYFQSYKSIIVMIDNSVYPHPVYLDKTYWDYSVTTGKYRNNFLGETIAETRQKIASGEYKLADLN